MTITDQERIKLTNAIDKRINIILEVKLLKILEVVKEKLNNNDFNFKTREKSLLKGIVAEHYIESFIEKKNSCYTKTNIELFTLCDKELLEIKELDSIAMMYNKFAVKKDKEKLISDYLKSYSQLKSIHKNEIYFSDSDLKIYKIAIPINEKEYIVMNLHDNSKIDNFDYCNINFASTLNKHGTPLEILDIIFKYENNNLYRPEKT